MTTSPTVPRQPVPIQKLTQVLGEPSSLVSYFDLAPKKVNPIPNTIIKIKTEAIFNNKF